MHGDRTVRVAQEIAFTTGGLIRVALFAAVAFAAMAGMVEDGFRPLPFVLGGMTVVAIALLLVHLRWQSRYGTATLVAEQPFDQRNSFTGTIVTGLREVPEAPIRLRIAGWSNRSEVTLSRATVDPILLRRADDGSLAIPFHILPSEQHARWSPREVRLHVRTAHWPVGWGATFVIAENG